MMGLRSTAVLYVLMILVVGILGVRLMHKDVHGPLERYSSYIVYPFLVVNNVVVNTFKNVAQQRRSTAELQERIKDLERERYDLLARLMSVEAQIKLDEDTKELREGSERYASAVVCVAHIIAKNFSDQTHYFLIDAGSSCGVTTDMVVVYKHCLLGKITHVYPWYSKVVALTDATCDIAAYCVRTGASGIHKGKNVCGQTHLAYVSHLETVEEGDYLVSSGTGLLFPRGFGLGVVTSCKHDGLYLAINVKPFVNLETIEFCSVLHKGLLPICFDVWTTATATMSATVTSDTTTAMAAVGELQKAGTKLEELSNTQVSPSPPDCSYQTPIKKETPTEKDTQR